ncbi:GGDEF domain-containing phosphodiesterase [Marinococcus luteus]|uniref:GGDEF domain-containing phosphodiesterase n=1 Tax=Marinococcus luteus TaxID=1122204 RepID=UPI002ACC662F|nr:GGDEF domain-containing phosphodiesterase [Marinococcus luteus]MDZ5782596.1 GGDEF domain-containing phosphodiesterase [Marinococcus luteus]
MAEGILDMLNVPVIIDRFEMFVSASIGISLFPKNEKNTEALVRWGRLELRLTLPDEFIPLAEETGLLIPLGRFILKEACRQTKVWKKETGLEPSVLEIELTENIIQHAKEAIPVLNQLKNLGMKLSLDDFGVGYSSPGYLKNFPLDTLKIGETFIQGMNGVSRETAIVESILHFAGQLNFHVIAEDVETSMQLKFLRQKNVMNIRVIYTVRLVSVMNYLECIKKRQ